MEKLHGALRYVSGFLVKTRKAWAALATVVVRRGRKANERTQTKFRGGTGEGECGSLHSVS